MNLDIGDDDSISDLDLPNNNNEENIENPEDN